MKHFFIIYTLFCAFLFVNTNTAAANSVWSELSDQFTQSIAHAEQGVSPQQSFSFGTIRSLSCQTGFKKTQSLLTGIHIDLKPGWTIQKYHLNILPQEAVKALTLTPLLKKATAQESWTSGYQGDIILPVALSIPVNSPDFSLDSLLTLTVCDINNQCQTKTVSDSLPLKKDENYETNWCGRLQFELQKTALPAARLGVKAKTDLQTDGTLRVVLSFPHAISYFEIQAQEQPYFLVSEYVQGKDAVSFTILPQKGFKLSEIKSLPVFLKTNYADYSLDLPIKTDVLPTQSDSLPIGYALLSGFLILLTSPLISFLLLSPAKSTIEFQKNIRQYQLTSIIAIILILCCWLGNFFPSEIYRIPFVAYALVPLLIYFLYRPVASPLLTGILIILLPKPFWDSFATITPIERLFLGLYWLLWLVIPLQYAYHVSDRIVSFYKHIKSEKNQAYSILAKLPYITLLTWTIIGLLGAQLTLGQETKPDPSHSTFIQIKEPLCATCLSDKFLLTQDEEFQKILHKRKIKVEQINAFSPQAKQIMDRIGTKHLPLYLFKKEDGRIFYLKQPLNNKKLFYFLNTAELR